MSVAVKKLEKRALQAASIASDPPYAEMLNEELANVPSLYHYQLSKRLGK